MGKKLKGGSSGDIDLGIDANACPDLFGDERTADGMAKRLDQVAGPILKKMGLQTRTTPGLFSVRCPIQSVDGSQEGEFVQLDLMPTRNAKFQAWSQYAPKEVEGEEYVKGAIRNLILESVAHAMEDRKVIQTGLVKYRDGVREGAVEWEVYSFYTPEGLNVKHCVRPLAKQKSLAEQGIHNSGDVSTRTLKTDDPDEIAAIMFGPKVRGKDILDWKGAWEAAKKAKWAKEPGRWDVFLDSLRPKIQGKLKAGFHVPGEILEELGLQASESGKLVAEGGHRFPNVGRLDQENAKATMDAVQRAVQEFMKVGPSDLAFLGSAGKKLPGGSSGDLDLALSKPALRRSQGVETVEEWYDLAEEFGRWAGVEVVNLERWGFQGTSVAWPVSNEDGRQDGQFVQVDLVPVDSLKYQTWAQFGPEEREGEEYVKGLVRNQLVSAVARVSGEEILEMGEVNGMEGEQPVRWRRYSQSHEGPGLVLKTFERPLMRGSKGEEGVHAKKEETVAQELVSDDPDEICQILLGVDSSKALRWDDVWSAVKNLGILRDRDRRSEFRKALSQGLERPLKNGTIDHLPQELADFLGMGQRVSESIRSTKDMSALDTPRKAMVKIHQLTGPKLSQFLSDLRDGLQDSSLVLRTTPKIDGYPFRVAWLDGKVLMELSYSGLMDRDGVEAERSVHPHERRFYQHVEEGLNQKMADFLRGIGLEGVKLIGELLANGDDIVDPNGTVTYVGTTYDSRKLGRLGTMVVIDAEGLTPKGTYELDDATRQRVVDFACEDLSDPDTAFRDLGKYAVAVDLDRSDFPAEFLEALDQFGRKGKPSKAEAESLRDQANAALSQLMRQKFPNPDLMPDGDRSLEGVAFELDGNLYGIHYQEWKDTRNGYFSEIDEMKDFSKSFLAKVAGLPERTGISQLVSAIRQNHDDCQRRYEELLPAHLKRAEELKAHAASRTDLPRFIDSLSKARADSLSQRFDPSRLTGSVDSLVEMVDGRTSDQGGRTVCLIPGSFRPPHAGHLAMIRHYSELADQVVVAVSGQTSLASQRPDKFGRSMPNYVAGEILRVYLQAAGLSNVKVELVSNPMNWLTATIRHLSNCRVMLGLSRKDDLSRFAQFQTPRFQQTLPPGTQILPVDEYAVDPSQLDGMDVSATWLREHLDDRDAIRKAVPRELSDSQFEKVYSLMNPEGDHPRMADRARADAFNQASESRLVAEGGHAKCQTLSEDQISRIDQENVAATLRDIDDRLLPALGLTKDDAFPVGSTGKKLPGHTSGDIDLAVDQNRLMEVQGIETPEEFVDFAHQVADDLHLHHGICDRYGWKAATYFWPISNTDGRQEDKYVQVDLVVTTNPGFAKWGMHSEPERELGPGETDADANPKSGVRNGLLQAIAMGGHTEVLSTGEVQGEGPDAPVEMERLDYSFNEGLFQVHRSRKARKDGSFSRTWDSQRTFLTDDPDRIVQTIYDDPSMRAEDLMTARDAYDALLDSDLWRDQEKRDLIGRHLHGIQKRHNWEIPSWMKF